METPYFQKSVKMHAIFRFHHDVRSDSGHYEQNWCSVSPEIIKYIISSKDYVLIRHANPLTSCESANDWLSVISHKNTTGFLVKWLATDFTPISRGSHPNHQKIL